MTIQTKFEIFDRARLLVRPPGDCYGGAFGDTSYRAFLFFARSVERLEGGVLLSFRSAIMGPEVYLKALATARNVAWQEQREIKELATPVFDLVPIRGNIYRELDKTDPDYYFRRARAQAGFARSCGGCCRFRRGRR